LSIRVGFNSTYYSKPPFTASLGNLDFNGDPAEWPYGCGGGLLVDRTIGLLSVALTLNHVQIWNNVAVAGGGGICSIAGEMTLSRVDVAGNALTGADAYDGTPYPETWGGGGLLLGGSLTANGVSPATQIHQNVATRGGGLYVSFGVVTLGDPGPSLVPASVSDNDATDGAGLYLGITAELRCYDGSAISFNDATGDGGGIASAGGSVGLDACDVNFNSAGDAGGGVWFDEGSVALTRSPAS